MILLTGAAGFIGSNVLRGLNKIGRDDVICVDTLDCPEKARNLVGKKFYRYRDYHNLTCRFDIIRKYDIDTVIHMGADSSTLNGNTREVISNNYDFSVCLLDALEDGQEDTTFIYASSASVYGQKLGFVTPDIFSETEQNERPLSPYAISKWMLDQYVRRRIAANAEEKTGGWITGLRLFNVYGPGETHKGDAASVAHRLLKQGLDDHDYTLFEGSKDIYRDFVYIDDVVQVVLWALDEGPSGILNVGTGQAHSFYNLFQQVASLQEYKGECRWVPFPAHLRAQYQFYTCANLRGLRAAGYTKDFTSLEKGTQKYWSNF
jgi:ADP-L-glycero-D-manno-heptose 6-epimerase